VRIAGRVQGVWFRGWTGETATTLGLDGWVRNRRDGTVEAVFSGSPEVIEKMIARCHDGPPHARVERVDVLEEPDYAGSDFEFRQTV